MAAVKRACCACCAGLQSRSGEIRWGGSEIRSLGGAYYADMTYLGHLSGVKDDPDRTGEPAHFQRARRDRSRC